MPYYKDHLNYNGFKTHCIGTKLKFVVWPKKCYFTNKTLWLKTAYEQVAMWTGPGDPVLEYRYYDKDEFLLARIKGIV